VWNSSTLVSVAVIPQGCVGVFPQWFLGVLF
jgi:hypothetical protein